MKVGEQLPFKQRVGIPWGHPSLRAVVLAVAEEPVPEAVRRYVDAVPESRARAAVVTGLGLGAGEPTLVLTDAWGEVFASWREDPGAWPDPEELVTWLDYIATQCPECSPLEPRWREELS